MPSDWSRSYAPGGGRWWVIAWEAGGFGCLHWSTVRLFDLGPAGAGALAAALAVLWLAGAWRIQTMGVYVGEPGLRIRGLAWTTTVPWTAIESISVVGVTHRGPFWSIDAGKALVVTRTGGARPIRALWERGVDFHARPAEFRQVAKLLRERHAAGVYGEAVRVGRERSSAT
jgi:hypothetical protein